MTRKGDSSGEEEYLGLNNRVNIRMRAEAQDDVLVGVDLEGVAGGDGHIHPKVPRSPASVSHNLVCASHQEFVHVSIMCSRCALCMFACAKAYM